MPPVLSKVGGRPSLFPGAALRGCYLLAHLTSFVPLPLPAWTLKSVSEALHPSVFSLQFGHFQHQTDFSSEASWGQKCRQEFHLLEFRSEDLRLELLMGSPCWTISCHLPGGILSPLPYGHSFKLLLSIPGSKHFSYSEVELSRRYSH